MLIYLHSIATSVSVLVGILSDARVQLTTPAPSINIHSNPKRFVYEYCVTQVRI